MKNTIKSLVNSYRAVFKNIHIGISYMALVAMLATGGISGIFMVTADIAVAQVSGNNFNESKDKFMRPKLVFTIEIHPKSSLEVDHQAKLGSIKAGTKLVIDIVRVRHPAPNITAPGSGGRLWLEISQEGLDIGENEITITKWSKLAFMRGNAKDRHKYFSSNGSGILKIRKEGTSFHGTAHCNFTDPSYV